MTVPFNVAFRKLFHRRTKKMYSDGKQMQGNERGKLEVLRYNCRPIRIKNSRKTVFGKTSFFFIFHSYVSSFKLVREMVC
jgi:hypothetical protein